MSIDRRRFMTSTLALATPLAFGACASVQQGAAGAGGSGRAADGGAQGGLAGATAGGTPVTAARRADSRPNIIFIVADDLGHADLGCYGGRNADFGPVSPVIDELARNGIRFTQGYSNSPVCSPTRFALISGRYQYRFRGGAEEPLSGASLQRDDTGMPPEHPTIPSLLRDAGYRTALIGKWHLGRAPRYGPLKSGYESFFGPMSGGVDYFLHTNLAGKHDLWRGDRRVHEEGYLTDLLSNQAVDLVDEMAGQDKPFFLSLHYTAPHWPWETRDDAHRAEALKDGRRLFDLAGGSVGVYRRMIRHMDEGIGWVMEALRRNGQLDNTLVIFTSDNGGERYSDNWPLVGGKMDLTEGGIRVPWIAFWPAVIKAGGVTSQASMSMDWSATVLDAAGVKGDPAHPLDGVSMLPVLRDVTHRFQRPMFWRMLHREQRAHRDGDWKYLRVDGHDYLFNIAEEERERANQAAAQPERLQRMRLAWEQWNASMPPIPADARATLGYTKKDMPQR